MPRLAGTPSVAVGILRPRRKQATVNLEWREHALCRGKDPEIWHPEQGNPNPNEVDTASDTASDIAAAAKARAYCWACPVRFDCLAHAIVESEAFGIWGGATERQRRAVRRLVPRQRAMSHAAWVAKVVRRLIELGTDSHGSYGMWAIGCRCDGCKLAAMAEREARACARGLDRNMNRRTA